MCAILKAGLCYVSLQIEANVTRQACLNPSFITGHEKVSSEKESRLAHIHNVKLGMSRLCHSPVTPQTGQGHKTQCRGVTRHRA